MHTGFENKKIIVPFLIVSFLFLGQLAAMPNLSPETPYIGADRSEDPPPGLHEQTSGTIRYKEKKGISPILLIIGGACLLTVFLMIFVLNKDYQILGEWTVTSTIKDGASYEYKTTFYGTNASGTTRWDNDGEIIRGTFYTVGKKVYITLQDAGLYIYFEGKFTDDNTISGDWNTSFETEGTWKAVRVIPAPAQSH